MIQSSEETTSQLQTQNNQLREQNNQLRQQASRAQAGLEAANARADDNARGAKAEVERLSSELRAKSEEIAGLQRDADTASAEMANLRRDAATAREGAALALEEARAETKEAQSKAGAAEKLAMDMKEAVAKVEEAARKASKSAKAEATRAHKAEAAKTSRAEAAAAAASRAAATAKASAAADVAAANQAAAASAAAAAAASATAAAASQAGNDEPQLQPGALALAGRLQALAARVSPTEMNTSSQPKLGKKRGREGATSTTAGVGTQEKVAGGVTPGGLPSHGAGGWHDDGSRAELPELTKEFCEFLAAYTAQSLPLDNLIRLIEAAPSLSERVGKAGDGGEEDAVPPPPSDGAKKKQRDEAVRRKDSCPEISATAPAPAAAPARTAATAVDAPAPAVAVASPAAAPDGSVSAVVVTPPESVMPIPRPTTSRREMLNARRKEQQRQAEEKGRIQEQRERERAERQREARRQRKKEAARQKPAEARSSQKATEAALLHKSGVDAGREAGEAGESAVATSARAAAARAAKAKAKAAPQPSALPVPSRPDQEREHDKPHQKQKQRRQQATGEGEGQKKSQRAQNVKSKRAKQTPTTLQQQQHHAQPPAEERPDGDIKPRAGGEDALTASSAGCAAPAPLPPRLPDATPATLEAVAAAAASAVPADHEEAGVAVEEVPMPMGDMDDGFFCADVGVGGVGGDPAAAGLIVGGGGDGYGTVGAWFHERDGSSAAGVGSSGASDSSFGGETKKGKNQSRTEEPAVELPATGQGSVETCVETAEGGGGAGGEGRKRRRRSMRWVHVVPESSKFQMTAPPLVLRDRHRCTWLAGTERCVPTIPLSVGLRQTIENTVPSQLGGPEPCPLSLSEKACCCRSVAPRIPVLSSRAGI